MSARQEELKQIVAYNQSEQQIALAGILAEEFQKHKVTLTVVGGAAVQYYTNAEYTTSDLDAILWCDSKEIVEEVMFSLGFQRTTTYRHFEHPLFPFVVEFPPSPVEVGGRYISDANILKMDGRTVRVIKIEDILMDRIIAAVEWKSSSHLDQAKLLWLRNRERINLPYLKDFAEKEGYLKTLNDIIKSTPAAKKPLKQPRKPAKNR